ncbi:MAG: dihydroorotate dehydrogenase [Gemmatimonadota bacterium]
MTLQRDVAGLHFSNPLMLASGTAGFGRELAGAMPLHRLGGLVTKAVSLKPREGNRAPRVAEFRGGMLNSVGLANPGVAHVRQHELPWLAQHLHGPRVLVNIVGFQLHEYAEVIAQLDDLEGHDGYEINLSCPNTSAGGVEFGADRGSVSAVIAQCRRVTQRPIFAKLSPALPDIPTLAAAARDAGADGISLVNTLPGMIFEGAVPRLGNGFGGISGPALLAAGLLAVRRTVERLPGCPVIGVGGVRSAADVADYLRAGAALVAIGTAALADPHLPERIINALEHADG